MSWHMHSEIPAGSGNRATMLSECYVRTYGSNAPNYSYDFCFMGMLLLRVYNKIAGLD